jgi:hypothetical protein
MNSLFSSPQLCLGKVYHKRLRPALHTFNYGVYFIRLPLRAMQQAPIRLALFSHNRFNLLSFYDKDHGDGKQPLLDWIDTLLKDEGISDADGEIWLQTFPRVLGYVFNPVSFWFCHNKQGQLRAVLAEVSNTFGERHSYLLDTGGVLAESAEVTARKIFHVSPFCAVEGKYRFRFLRSRQTIGNKQEERTIARIDYDDDKGPLLLTSIAGSAQVLSNAVVAKAFFLYPLMTFGVMARIHWQALRLWLKRVPFFSKPLPPAQEISR